jgi:hypothetical protein
MHSPRNAFNGDALEHPIPSEARESEHQIHVLVSVDYSKKYGLGYLINNRQYGVYFNDETLMSTDLESKRVYYIDNPVLRED